MNNRPFGHTPLLELDLYDKDVELLTREHLFQHHVIEQETLGGVWHGGEEVRARYWYNPAVEARWRRAYQQEREAVQAELDAKRKAQREYKSTRAKTLEEIEAVRARAAWILESRQRRATWVKEEFARVDREREAAELKRLADIEHERKRRWANRTSRIERRITLIVDTIDANGDDRAMMRAMLRYMSLGPGLGKPWDIEEFVHYYRRVDAFSYYARIDAERCYTMLKNRHKLLYARRFAPGVKMPITITGDMTQEQVDEAMLQNLRELIASGSSGGTLQISHRQAVHLLDMAEAGKKDKPKKDD